MTFQRKSKSFGMLPAIPFGDGLKLKERDSVNTNTLRRYLKIN